MGQNHIHERLGKRYSFHILILLSMLLMGMVAWGIWSVALALPTERTTIALAGDPVRIVSWDSARKKVTILSVPVDVRITGVHDLGLLPIGSLERLEALDAKNNDIYRRSLSRAFAVPIKGVLRGVQSIQTVREALSPWAMLSEKRSGLSMALQLRLWWTILWIRPDAVEEFDAVEGGVTSNVVLPDGSQTRVLDGEKYDTRTAGLFEIDAVRREELRVRVVNTTGVAGRGAAFARVLSHAGLSVVALENDDHAQQGCSFQSNTGRTHHKTRRFLEDTLGCRYLESTEKDADVDITVALGSGELF